MPKNTMSRLEGKFLTIAGPCAAETRDQVLQAAHGLKERQVDALRASLWKPRTAPGFEGMGTEAISWLGEVAQLGLAVATEVMLPDHVTTLINNLGVTDETTQLILWLGSRNQNHLVQSAIAKRLAQEGPKTALLMIKNQPWLDEKHWMGIVDHVTAAGFPPDRILLCHRGFSPNGHSNPANLRNLPDFDMAMRVKEKTGRPMILDPSHIGGSPDNVLAITQTGMQFPFDGIMVEVHPHPQTALTDSRQQLSLSQLDQLLRLIRQN